jgi:O-acetyl-ADP-ribose deacetylase
MPVYEKPENHPQSTMSLLINNHLIQLCLGDITELHVDAIVNAANEHLSHGGGVAAAISKKGGSSIQQESHLWVRTHGLVKTGSAAVTSGGRLKAKYIIHAVGPVYGSGDEENKLSSAVRSALQIAESMRLGSIAFPAISTGIFGFPVDRCARIMIDTLTAFFQQERFLKTVVLCLWDQATLQIFTRELERRRITL